MNSKTSIALTVVFTLLCGVLAQDLSMTKCKGSDITLSDSQVMNVNDCLNSTGAASVQELNKDQKACFAKCVMIKQGLVDDSGMLKKDQIPTTFATGLPEAVKLPLTTQISKCFETAGGKVKMDNPTCAEFTPICDCVGTAYATLCK